MFSRYQGHFYTLIIRNGRIKSEGRLHMLNILIFESKTSVLIPSFNDLLTKVSIIQP